MIRFGYGCASNIACLKDINFRLREHYFTTNWKQEEIPIINTFIKTIDEISQDTLKDSIKSLFQNIPVSEYPFENLDMLKQKIRDYDPETRIKDLIPMDTVIEAIHIINKHGLDIHICQRPTVAANYPTVTEKLAKLDAGTLFLLHKIIMFTPYSVKVKLLNNTITDEDIERLYLFANMLISGQESQMLIDLLKTKEPETLEHNEILENFYHKKIMLLPVEIVERELVRINTSKALNQDLDWMTVMERIWSKQDKDR